MVLIAVETVPTGIKPPVAVSVRLSTGRRHGVCSSAPLSTMASPIQRGRVEGSVESSPQLVRHIRSGSTFFAEQLSPWFVWSFSASSVRVWVLVSVGMSAKHLAPGLLDAVMSLSSPWSFLTLVHRSCRKISPALQTSFGVLTSVSFHLTTQMYLGERSHYPRGQPCSSSVAS